MGSSFQRKRIRLPDYDYSSPGYYFVTFCTKDRVQILGRIASGNEFKPPEMVLNRFGEAVRSCIEEIPAHYPSIQVVKYVVMPNHVHLILTFSSENTGNPALSTVIQQLKRAVSVRTGKAFWQPRYYEHVIRDENEFLEIWKYIDTNPIKWELDKYYQK